MRFPNKDEAIDRIIEDQGLTEEQALSYFDDLVTKVAANMLLTEYIIWYRWTLSNNTTTLQIDSPELRNQLNIILKDKTYYKDFPNITPEEFFMLYDKELFTLFCKKTNRNIVKGKDLFMLNKKEFHLLRKLKDNYAVQ